MTEVKDASYAKRNQGLTLNDSPEREKQDVLALAASPRLGLDSRGDAR